MTHNKPIHEIRLGTIRAAIWANERATTEVWFNVSLSRLYNDGNGWRDSHAFGRDDLPVAAKVLEMAYAWIWDHQAAPSPQCTAQ